MPDWTQHVRPRLSGLRLSPTREAEIVEELSQHLDDRWRELIASGMSPDEATRVALADFKDGKVLAAYMAPLRQAHTPSAITPGAPSSNLFSDLWQDLRYTARTLWKRPAFTLAAVLTLAIGIGSNAAIFTVINSVLLRPLPFPHSEQLVSLYTRYLPSSGFDFPFFALSGPEFADVRRRVNAFEGVAAFQFGSGNLTRGNGEAERVVTLRVTSEFFNVLGVKPVRGRTFTEEEVQRGGSCLAVVSNSAFADAASAIGSIIRLDDAPCEVIGVMPEGFSFRDDSVKVWTPFPVNTERHGTIGGVMDSKQSLGYATASLLRKLRRSCSRCSGTGQKHFPITTRMDILPSSCRCKRTSSAIGATRWSFSPAPSSSCC